MQSVSGMRVSSDEWAGKAIPLKGGSNLNRQVREALLARAAVGQGDRERSSKLVNPRPTVSCSKEANGPCQRPGRGTGRQGGWPVVLIMSNYREP